MAYPMLDFEHFTPPKTELQPFHKIRCQEADCEAIFTNSGNYDLHLQKHHKIIPQRCSGNNAALRMYHCPEPGCVYYWKVGSSGRHFKHMKNLRQHFQKVHVKTYVCEQCGRAFPTTGQFQKHVELACGKRFHCNTCGWVFETKESLALHGKRKGHNTKTAEARPEIGESIVPAKKIRKGQMEETKSDTLSGLKGSKDSKALSLQNKNTQTYTLPVYSVNLTNVNTQCDDQVKDGETQTEHNEDLTLVSNALVLDSEWHAIYQDTETQTEIVNSSSRNIFEDFHDIETQTESPAESQQYYQQTVSPASNSSNSVGGFRDHMLSHTPLTNMYTQTCDDFLLSELGLTDIQTQTNWSIFSDSDREYNKHMYVNTSTSTTTATGFAHDELLVSTETQTSFTQCLLDSTAESCRISSENAATCNTGCGTGDESNTSNYVHLYNTQHTQTCDLLLESLFGGQENDLIGGFQSTYTQT